MTPKINLSPKAKKIINIVVDVVCGLILVIALIFAISSISSKAKGYDQYTEIFGKAYLAVQSDSMKGDGKDNFAKGDLIVIKTLNIEEVRKLKVDDIITFQTNKIADDGTMVLNSHRIVEIIPAEGDAITFKTKGDNNEVVDKGTVSDSEVVGIYQGKASGIGHMFLFMGTSAGFFTCVVLPTLIVVAYAAVNLVLVILKERKVQAVASEEAKQAEREKMRAELLAEMGMPAETAETKEEQPEQEQTPAEEEKLEEEKPEQEQAPAEDNDKKD